MKLAYLGSTLTSLCSELALKGPFSFRTFFEVLLRTSWSETLVGVGPTEGHLHSEEWASDPLGLNATSTLFRVGPKEVL